MRFLRFSRQMAEAPLIVKENCYEPYVWISINEPKNRGRNEARPVKNECHQDTLELYFDDGDKPTSKQLMTEDHANQILDFVEKHEDDISLICVQCEWGLSVSPPIVEALCFWLNGTTIEDRGYSPSKHVLRVMQEAIIKREECET